MDKLYKYISVFELSNNYGVKEGYINLACYNYRQGKSKSWENIKHPKDGRMVLIKIATIPERTRKKHNIPTEQEWEDIQKISEYQHQQDQEEYNYLCYKNDLLEAYNNNWLPQIHNYNKLFKDHPNKTELAKKFAQEQAFWLTVLDYTGGAALRPKKNTVRPAFNMYQELKAYIPFHNKISGYTHFSRRLGEMRKALFNEKPITELITGKHYLKVRHKTTTRFHKGMALYYLSHPKIYPYRVVTDLINYHAEQENLELITESWVKKLMATDRGFKTIVEKNRYGKKYYNDNIASFIPRQVSPFPANVWMIDGTPMQFYCWNKDRTKLIRLYLFTVLDVCTRKIVGFDIALSEDRFIVANAIKTAVSKQGHLPAEIVSDNFSANKTEEIKELKHQFEQLGTIWRHAGVNNPQDKSYAERFYGSFQSISCALYDDYLGEGITSKRKNARPNKEFLAQVARKKGYAGYDEMRLRIAQMIDHYNRTETSKRQSPNKLYNELPKPHAKELNLFNISLLFWKKTTCKIRRGMVKIQVRKLEYFYEIKDHNIKKNTQDTTVAVRYDEADLSQVMLFDLTTNEPICECKQVVRVNVGHIDRTEQDEKQTLRQTAKKKSYGKQLDKEAFEIVKEGLESVDKDVADFKQQHPLCLMKNQVNKAEDEAMATHYKIVNNIREDTETYKPVPIIELDFMKDKTSADIEEELFTRKKAPRNRA